MFRTQIYLTPQERQGLTHLAEDTGQKQSALIREAIDLFLETAGEQRRKAVLDKAAGMWQNRTDLPDFAVQRASWDRE